MDAEVKDEFRQLHAKLDTLLTKSAERDLQVVVLEERDRAREESVKSLGERVGTAETKLTSVKIAVGVASGTAAGVGALLSQLF